MSFLKYTNINPELTGSIIEIKENKLGDSLNNLILGDVNSTRMTNDVIDILYENLPDEDKILKFRPIPYDTGNGEEYAYFLCTKPIDVTNDVPPSQCPPPCSEEDYQPDCPDAIGITIIGKNLARQFVKIRYVREEGEDPDNDINDEKVEYTESHWGNIPAADFYPRAFVGPGNGWMENPNGNKVTIEFIPENFGTNLYRDPPFEMDIIIKKIYDSPPPRWLREDTSAVTDIEGGAFFFNTENAGSLEATVSTERLFLTTSSRTGEVIAALTYCSEGKIEEINYSADSQLKPIPDDSPPSLDEEIFLDVDLVVTSIKRTFKLEEDENGPCLIETRLLEELQLIDYIEVKRGETYTTPLGDIISYGGLVVQPFNGVSTLEKNFPFPAPAGYLPKDAQGVYNGVTGSFDVYDVNGPYLGNPPDTLNGISVPPRKKSVCNGIFDRTSAKTGIVGFYWNVNTLVT